MLSYIAAVKRGLRDKFKFKPKVDGPDPVFAHGQVPDGTYPMKIEGRVDKVKIVNGTISCCNWD